MLYLLFSIPLNPLQECLKLQLLLALQIANLSVEFNLQQLLHIFPFNLLELVSKPFRCLGLIVIFDTVEYLFLLPGVNDVLGPSMPLDVVVGYSVSELLYFVSLLLFELLH